MSLYSFQGIVLIGERGTNGYPKGLDDIGNVPEFTIQTEVDQVDHYESRTGLRAKDAILYTQSGAMLSLTMDDFANKNLARILAGAVNTQSGSSVTGEIFSSTGVVAGQYLKTAYPDISSVTIKDSAGTPATLSINTHYIIADAKRGIIYIVNVGSFTQPFTIDYTYASSTRVDALVDLTKEYTVALQGIDTAQANAKCTVTIHKVKIRPGTELPLINNEFGQYQVEMDVLLDTARANSTTNSGYFKIEYHG